MLEFAPPLAVQKRVPWMLISPRRFPSPSCATAGAATITSSKREIKRRDFKAMVYAGLQH